MESPADALLSRLGTFGAWLSVNGVSSSQCGMWCLLDGVVLNPLTRKQAEKRHVLIIALFFHTSLAVVVFDTGSYKTLSFEKSGIFTEVNPSTAVWNSFVRS